MKTLIKNVYTVLPDGSTPLTNIMIDQDKIMAIGEVPAGFHAGKIIDGTNRLAVPGFVNAHTHTSMTLLRSYADDMALMDWLNNKIWPVEARMNEDDIYWGAMLAVLEMVQSGTTAFADMYGPYMDRVAEATADAGIRGVLSRGIIGVAPDGEKKIQEKYVANMGDFDNYVIALREGSPHVEVLKYARENKADLIVMAHHTKDIDPKNPNRPNLKAAYHLQCMGCHQGMNVGRPKNTDCTTCHKARP